MRVFKYRSGDDKMFLRDIETLAGDRFWAPTKDNLNDPCEGLVLGNDLIDQIAFFHKVFSLEKSNSEESLAKITKSLNDLLSKTEKAGIYALSKSSTDELLWAHYASSHTGFCIEYDLDTLVHFGGTDYFTFDVIYSDRPPSLSVEDMPSGNSSRNQLIQKLMGYKSKRWSYEREVRVVTSFSGSQSYDFRAVKSIYFGLNMPDEKRQDIMKALSGRGIRYFEIKLKGNSYEFVVNPVEDRYPTDKKYLYSIAPIAVHAVSPKSLNKRWTEFSPYLQKVAEIVRREPYCKEVNMVEVSFEKSKPGKPVFFGQFKRSKFRWETLYYTPKEIDKKYAEITDLSAESDNV
ncbi:DUF2971 domain-containing protein [Microbulbifer zhoushanensis]|uniref:DUF2971 domain-containing protein n=1 Tax=Microbulbifer zhoushanensis TaxID=2904254 RepID=UPI001F434864|nr:DUF2971 domain-containing protein [Microbulbifer zhoushanensis]